MSEAERELFRRAREGDREAVEELLSRHAGLAAACVRRFRGRGAEEEDLMQEGMMGLYIAIGRYDGTRGTAFSTFAVPHVLGRLRRFLQKSGTLSASRRDIAAWGRLREAEDRLLSEGGAVSLSRLAEEAGIEAEEASVLLSGAYLMTEPDAAERVGVCGGEEEAVRRADLEAALRPLPAREKEIIFRRYFRNESQDAVALRLGLSQAQISRLEKKILRCLRSKLEWKENF